LIALLAALAGCTDPTVTRIVDGRPVEGRFISDTAYALYARGAQAEAAGDLAGALRAFMLAALQDPESPDVWTRIGALHCRLRPGRDLPPLAEAAFERARAIDPGHAALYRERARCLISAGDPAVPDLALADAERALALDPDDLDTALVHASALDRVGRAGDAVRALRALTLRHPTSVEPWRAMLDLARRTGNAALAGTAAERLAHLGQGPPGGVFESPLAAIDRALEEGDLTGARRRALRHHVSGAEVALRAIALGLPDLARAQGELVLGADPADASARIALAAVADLRGDLAAVADLLRSIPRAVTPPSPLGRWIFAEVLRRRVGAEAARAWLGEAKEEGEGDPLLAATEKRVRAALAGPGGDPGRALAP
jgi:tetratricopeptide (TPR) repeat protein